VVRRGAVFAGVLALIAGAAVTQRPKPTLDAQNSAGPAEVKPSAVATRANPEPTPATGVTSPATVPPNPVSSQATPAKTALAPSALSPPSTIAPPAALPAPTTPLSTSPSPTPQPTTARLLPPSQIAAGDPPATRGILAPKNGDVPMPGGQAVQPKLINTPVKPVAVAPATAPARQVASAPQQQTPTLRIKARAPALANTVQAKTLKAKTLKAKAATRLSQAYQPRLPPMAAISTLLRSSRKPASLNSQYRLASLAAPIPRLAPAPRNVAAPRSQ
jgi:hypothetical protein